MQKSNIWKALAVLSLCGAGAMTAAPVTAVAAPKENCRVEPDAKPSQNKNATPSQKLNDCGSVLRPPGVGDNDMVQPAPDVGRTPVIPPNAVPKTQNQGNGTTTK